jgi:hypothetical protein
VAPDPVPARGGPATLLSDDADRLTSAVLLAFVVGALVAAVFGLVMVLRMPGAGSPGRSSAATTVTTYDVDADGEPEFAKIDGRVHAVPSDPDGGASLAGWLQLAGTLGAALIGVLGGLAVKALKRVNREGGERIHSVEDRLAALEEAAE